MRTADLSASAADDCGGRQRRIDAGYFTGGTGPAEKAGAGVNGFFPNGELKINRS